MLNILSFLWSGKQKQTFLVWLAVYPIITGLAWGLDPILKEMILPIRTLVLSGLMVPIMVYGAMPLINKLFK